MLKWVKLKGGVTYLSDVIVAITSMFSTMFMLFIAALMIFIVNSNIVSTVYGDLLYDAPAAGLIMTDILDTPYDDSLFIKDVLAYSIWMGSDNFDLKGKKADVKTLISSALTSFGVSEYSANFTIGEREIPLPRAGIKPQSELKCADHKIFADGKTGELKICTSRTGA